MLRAGPRDEGVTGIQAVYSEIALESGFREENLLFLSRSKVVPSSAAGVAIKHVNGGVRFEGDSTYR